MGDTAERNMKNPRTRPYSSFILANSGFDEAFGYSLSLSLSVPSQCPLAGLQQPHRREQE